MITLLQFKRLTVEKQVDVLLTEGCLIARRTNRTHLVMLYQIDAFYVEIYYDRKLDLFTDLKSFLNTRLLEPYLCMIPLDDIV
jgi:hypothetical protein